MDWELGGLLSITKLLYISGIQRPDIWKCEVYMSQYCMPYVGVWGSMCNRGAWWTCQVVKSSPMYRSPHDY